MRLAIIDQNNIVVNVVIADEEFAVKMKWNFVELDDVIPCEIGWLYDGKFFNKPIIIGEDNAEIV